MVEYPEKMTASELVIKVMEEFGESEPNDCVVVFTRDDGQLALRGNVRDRAKLVGMLQLSCQMVFNNSPQG